MKWQAKEVDLYLQAKEYVDTAIIPLVPISWGDELKSTVQMGEFITLISDELERQFKGRVFQFPSFTYLKSEKLEERLLRLNAFDEHLKSNGISHIIFLTSDVEWKQIEAKMNDTLLWIPSIPLEHMEQKYKMETLSSQIKQMLPIITSKWQKAIIEDI
ncbi:MAG: YpiF family protein [Anaerobacillus sp.]|uniref:YpiF family protein n=1 Tax=Anaerobacillus sp. TaxID=1872506 RepID=UPI003919F493